MKALMYFKYTARSLFRGGQRTILAILCVAVGVMAIVALQLVGFMLQSSLTSNMRDANGGDIAVITQNAPLKDSDMSVFANLQRNGVITGYTAMTSENGFIHAAAPASQSFTVTAVDQRSYPLVSQPTFTAPANGSIANLLGNNQVIVTQSFLDTYSRHMGDSFPVYIKTQTSSGRTLHVTIDGVIPNTGIFAQSSSLVLISTTDFTAAAPTIPLIYTGVDVTTANQANTAAAVKVINQQIPLASTQTVADALKTQQSSIDLISKFLEVAGLLALLIGGIGIINTMGVLLSRRKTEIAMLKTAGYRRLDLSMLFGLEAGMIGLIGGILGAAAATGVSYLVRGLMQNLGQNVPYVLNPWMIAGGVAIGFATSLIFGLMPIAQAANIRPLNVIRDLSVSKSKSGMFLTVLLLLILSVLFCGLAVIILNHDVVLGIEAIYGTFALLLLLSAFFGLVIFGVSKLPIPERFNLPYLALVLIGLLISAGVYLLWPIFGLLLFIASLLTSLVIFLPRSWKVNTKMALRNIGRERTRATTTVLALFIGVFAIGLVLTMGQDLQTQISSVFSQSGTYNVMATTTGEDTALLHARLGSIPGLSKSRTDTLTSVLPISINQRPMQAVLPSGGDRQTVLGLLTTMEGYNLSQVTPNLTMMQGRNLNTADTGTDNVIISGLLASSGPVHMSLKPGDKITLAAGEGKKLKTLTIVGIYSNSQSLNNVGGILASNTEVQSFSATKSGPITITYMKIDPSRMTPALNRIGQIVPNATVQNMADIGAYFVQQLKSIMEILATIASLSLLAGIVIIANAVALAMLERRRELGILKAVGYTSGSVLSEVAIENGIIGVVGAFIAMLLASGAATLLGNMLFNLSISVSPLIAVSLIGGSSLLAMFTALLVAWGAVRIRPLEVLRYE